MKSRTLLAVLLAGTALIAAIGAWTSGSAGAAGQKTTEITASRFELTIDGHSLAVFDDLETIVSGLDADGLGLVARNETFAVRQPAKRPPPSIRLTRDLSRNIEMAAWHELVVLGDMDAARKSVSLTAYNRKGDPVARYHLTNAWPSKVEVTGIKAGASQVLQETVTLVAEFMQRVAV